MLFFHVQNLGWRPQRQLTFASAKALAESWGVKDFEAAIDTARRPDGTLCGECICRRDLEHLPGEEKAMEYLSVFDCYPAVEEDTDWFVTL